MPFSLKNKLSFFFFYWILSVFHPAANYFAQNKLSDNLTIQTNYHYGFSLPEYSSSLYFINDYARSFSMDVSKKMKGKNDWEQIYKYPEFGISLFYSTLGNNAIYGQEVALCLFFRIDYINRNRFKLYNQFGLGPDYITKKFNLENNYANIAVGSKVNMHFNIRLGASMDISDKFRINSGLSFDHFSNGNTQEPNLGINLLLGYAGLGFLIGEKTTTNTLELQPLIKKNHFAFFYSVGGKHAHTLDAKYYFISSSSFEFARDLSRIVQIGTGADLFYDSSTETEMLAAHSLQPHKKIYNYRSGIHLSQKLIYNKFSFEIQEGVYLLLQDKVTHRTMYNRGIIGFNINEHLMVRLSLKSHVFILDYQELGIGYKL